jgi:hypothetical protein
MTRLEDLVVGCRVKGLLIDDIVTVLNIHRSIFWLSRLPAIDIISPGGHGKVVVGGFGLQADKEVPNSPQFNNHSRREAALTLVAACRDAPSATAKTAPKKPSITTAWLSPGPKSSNSPSNPTSMKNKKVCLHENLKD